MTYLSNLSRSQLVLVGICAAVFLGLVSIGGWLWVESYRADAVVRAARIKDGTAAFESMQAKLAEDRRQENIDACLQLAKEEYHHTWNETCNIVGKLPPCSLSIAQAKVLNDNHEKSQNICLRRY